MRELIALLLVLLACAGASRAHAAEAPLRVCLVSGSAEYDSDASLAAFQEYLEEGYNAECTLLKARGFEELPGLEALDDCEVALFFTRRLTIEGEQLERVKRYCQAGRPIVAVRTASHGFQNWLEFDKLILGGNYHGHFGRGPTTKVVIEPEAKGHPVLEGVVDLKSRASLYKTAPLAEDAQLLMTGSTPESEGSQPVTWTRTYKGARVFYTSLGGQEDFENATFLRLIANALFWAAEREVERHELAPPAQRPRPEGTLRLKLRSRVETFKGSGVWDEVTVQKELPVAETAILICDMWDTHWCREASQRCGEIAQRMAPVVEAARAKGVQIIHCPSETLYFYADWPQRRRMMLAPKVEPPEPLDIPEPELPIDASDGGCESDDEPYSAWTRQDARIEIGPYDGISHSGTEVYNLLRQLGIENLIVMGVHTNMCVLGRSFAIRQMTRWGIRCMLVRDLTDTMYDPKMAPFVSHDEGTELVVQHIEKYWGPSLLSSDLVAGLP
ncbi:MAG: isochorismatase family protein [Armatimonadota bacterium]